MLTFDDITAGQVMTTQYPGVTFSTESGIELRSYTTGTDWGTSRPNFLCAAPVGGAITCVGDVYLDFSPAVSNITFAAVGADDSGIVAHVRLYQGATLLTTYELRGGMGSSQIVNPGSFSGVTRLEIDYVYDGGGIGWDDFRFVR